MPVTLPRAGRGGPGGKGECGARTGRGGSLPNRERNPMLVSNSNNSTLLVSISPLPSAPGQPPTAPAPAIVTRAQQYTNDIAASTHGSAPLHHPAGPGSALSLIGSSTAAAALTKAAMMINILSKNDSSKNNQAYSLDAIKGMRNQISSLKKPILATVQAEMPGSFAAMTNLLHLPKMQRVYKWGHAEALVKIWELFRGIPTLVDGSFVGRYMRPSNELNNDLDTFIGIMTSVEQLADEELGRKIESI
jgi:hypothetical protein